MNTLIGAGIILYVIWFIILGHFYINFKYLHNNAETAHYYDNLFEYIYDTFNFYEPTMLLYYNMVMTIFTCAGIIIFLGWLIGHLF